MVKLEAQNVAVTFQSSQNQSMVKALEAVNFKVREGQFVAIIGPSGCGKSTLLNGIAGLQSLTNGRLLLDGKEILEPGHNCAMVFQAPSLMPWRTLIRNITYGLELRGLNAKDAQQIGQEYLELVGLKGFEENFPHELSGGMQQRANVARALAVKPGLLLLDEPFSSLDALTRQYLQLELLRIWRQTKVTAIYVTHQISEAILLADQVIIMTARPGKIKAIVDIPLQRPRELSIKRSKAFNDLEKQIWYFMKEEITQMGIDFDNRISN